MKAVLFNPRFLLCTSVLFSLLFHWAIFNTFVVVFPMRAQPHKPKLIFLGPLLQSSDMAEALPGNKAEPDALKHLNKIRSSENLYNSTIEKPVPQRRQEPKLKRTLKTTEASEVEESPRVDPMTLHDLKIERTIEPYIPLRLKDHD